MPSVSVNVSVPHRNNSYNRPMQNWEKNTTAMYSSCAWGLAAVSILLSVFNNCVPQQWLDGYSVTRAFLSVKGVAYEFQFLIRRFDVGWWLSVDSMLGYTICNMHPTFLFECLYDQQDSDQYCSFHLKSAQMWVPQHWKNWVKERVNSCLQLVLDRMMEPLVDKFTLCHY